MGYKVNLTNLQNVAAGNTATLKCPVGKGAPTYDQIKLILAGGATPAMISFIRGKANGRIFMDEATGSVINARDDYRGVPSAAGFVVLDFTEPHARNGSAEQLVASVPGSLLQDLTFEIGLTAGFLGSITAVANYRPPTSNPYIRKLLMIPQSFAAAGPASAPNIMYLPTGGAGGKIKRVWIHEDGLGNVIGVQLRIANNVVFDATRAQAENDQTRQKLVPQLKVFALDFIDDGNLAGMLDTAAAPQVELRLITDNAGSYRAFIELIDPIGRL